MAEILVLLIVIVTTVWVAYDADGILSHISAAKRKSLGLWGPGQWATGCLLVWILVFPAYLFKRQKYLRIVRGL